MTAPLILALFVGATAVLAPRHLLRASWVHRSPRWGIWAWQAVSLAVTLAVLLIGVTLALPILPIGPHLTELVRTTHLDVTDHYTTPAGNGLAVIAAVFSVALFGRAAILLFSNLRRSARRRAQQVEGLRLIGTRHPGGFTVINHPVPLVYCLPGRQRAVVVTRAAMEVLTPQELDSVLAHERTHLRARHDLALAVADALSRTFRGIGLFTTAHQQVATLVEMQADDAARGVGARHAMASALVTLGSTVRSPAAPTETNRVAARIRRLAEASPSIVRPRQRLAVGACTVALLSAPVALALAPAMEASARDCCHVALPADPQRK
ncbi:M56 family metallopeptidase [Nocardioides sp. T2.26MG-1]|uniref:M56 family metallopeptidase n=1 Tax=Nocardioides sp. T2.26MG-1 TaxID=3041166 RepID=UPI00247761D9|nr:M56 family metallopeptidase [Nocardioides sp. T2.26MG-1]CAI9419315.1 Protease HtpX [Nocardioides sp. T2.26MG-1]